MRAERLGQLLRERLLALVEHRGGLVARLGQIAGAQRDAEQRKASRPLKHCWPGAAHALPVCDRLLAEAPRSAEVAAAPRQPRSVRGDEAGVAERLLELGDLGVELADALQIVQLAPRDRPVDETARLDHHVADGARALIGLAQELAGLLRLATPEEREAEREVGVPLAGRP